MSKNVFRISNNKIYIGHPEWNDTATVSVLNEYMDELMSVTWSAKGNYIYSNKLEMYLHVYVMRYWYGNECYEKMRSAGCVVDHMDNNGHNCCIDNLAFLPSDENKAKGFTVDKMSAPKEYIALSMYKDFSTQLFQITVFFNYPAKAVLRNFSEPACVELVMLLYDCDYEMVINDARAILYQYYKDYSFEPEKLHYIDYHIEGRLGEQISYEQYDAMLKYQTVRIIKKAPSFGWNRNAHHEYCHFRL